MHYDVVIIGAGPAGMTAALYCARANLKVLLIEKDFPGGQMNDAVLIENYPGVDSMSGADLALKMFNQLDKYPNITFLMQEVVEVGEIEKGLFIVKTDDTQVFTSTAVINSTGMTHKKIEELKPFEDQGFVHYCATCDGPLYAETPVAVIGDGNTAVTYALELSKYCSTVYLFTLTDKLYAEDINIRLLKNQPNIIQIVMHNPSYEMGQEMVYIKNGVNLYLVTAIFVAIGMIKNELNDANALDEDGVCQDGYFTAGDCEYPHGTHQVSIAVGSGTLAALAVIEWVRECSLDQ